jgi:ATP-dependent DNA helicase PIF1
MHAVNDVFVEHGRSLQDIGFTLPDRPSDIGHPACFRSHVFSYDECVAQREIFVSRFTSEQHEAMSDVLQAIDEPASTARLFKVLSSAGTGKSWFVNGITWQLRAQSRIVLNVAASALAATVLAGGRTAHSTFRIPIPASSSSLCGVKAGERQLIREAAIIFYDEISMVSVDVANTLDRSLREIMKNSLPFGGKVVVFLGDFKQLLPVIPGVRGDVTVKDCEWWQLCRPIKFTINWRAACNPEFSEFLHQVGMGILEEVEVPSSSRVQSIKELVTAVYGDDMTTAPLHRNLILAVTLDTCEEINRYCMAMMPGPELIATATDILPGSANPDTYPQDYVASIAVHGAPPATLTLKLNARCVNNNRLHCSPQLTLITGI